MSSELTQQSESTPQPALEHGADSALRLETFYYDNKTVKQFAYATIFWGLVGMLAGLWAKPLAGDPHELFRAAADARRILYLADNAGEIVFDRLLIEALPHHKMTVAVRGRPILNDALHEDAVLAGIAELATLIDNDSDAPGTVLADCSEVFLSHFHAVDLIIAKGQGNFETLSYLAAPVFFLFTVKCPLVAEQIGEPTGTMVVKPSPAWASRRHLPHSPPHQNAPLQEW